MTKCLRPLAVVAMTLIGTVAQAALVTTSTTNFDGFANGTVNGQGGWGVTHPTIDQKVVDLGSGNKVLQLSNKVTSGGFGDQTFAPRPGGIVADSVTNPSNGQPGFFAGESSTGATYNKFVGSFDFRSAATSSDIGAFVSISPDNGSGGRQGYIGLEGTGTGFNVIGYDITGAGGFAGPTVLASYGFGDWHNMRYEIQFNDGSYNDVASIYIDNVLVSTVNSWERYFEVNQPALHPLGVPVQTLLFRAGGAASPSAVGFQFDNVTVQLDGAAVVPEPGSLALVALALGGLALARRRTKR